MQSRWDAGPLAWERAWGSEEKRKMREEKRRPSPLRRGARLSPEWRGQPPSVMGHSTESDLSQLSTLLSVHPGVIAVVLLVVQAGLLCALIRWTCVVGVKRRVKDARRERKRHREAQCESRKQRFAAMNTNSRQR